MWSWSIKSPSLSVLVELWIYESNLNSSEFFNPVANLHISKKPVGVYGVVMRNTIAYPTQQSSSPFSWYTLFSQTRKWRTSHSGITVPPGMEEMPSLNMPVQMLKVAILPLDLPCSGSVTHSGEI